MMPHIKLPLLGIFSFVLLSCLSAEEEFTQDRLLTLCEENYHICQKPAGCVLDEDHFVEGVFPGTRRVVVVSDEVDGEFRVRVFFKSTLSPGTELLVQMYETNCTLNAALAQERIVDVDIFEESGDDRVLDFELKVQQKGEHLVEIYSDASAEFLLTVDPI